MVASRLRHGVSGVLILALVQLCSAKAQTLPHSFSNGQVADANQVNENFSALLIAVQQLSSRVEVLEERVRNLETDGTTIRISDVSLGLEEEALLSVTLTTDTAIAGTQNDIQFPQGVQLSACEVNPTIMKSGTAFSYSPGDCEPGVNCESVRAIVLGMIGFDPNPLGAIASGSVLYTCIVNADFSGAKVSELTCTEARSSDPTGTSVQTECVSGFVSINSGTACTGDCDTIGQACTGDCDDNGQVSVDELVRGVNIALGNVTPNLCPSFDRNGDGAVTVDELVSGLNAALNEC